MVSVLIQSEKTTKAGCMSKKGCILCQGSALYSLHGKNMSDVRVIVIYYYLGLWPARYPKSSEWGLCALDCTRPFPIFSIQIYWTKKQQQLRSRYWESIWIWDLGGIPFFPCLIDTQREKMGDLIAGTAKLENIAWRRPALGCFPDLFCRHSPWSLLHSL